MLKLEATHSFYREEAEFYRLGKIAYVTMLALTLTNKIEAEGGIGPFEFWCRPSDGTINPIVMHACEL